MRSIVREQGCRVYKGWLSLIRMLLSYKGLLWLCAMWETDCRDQVCGCCSEWELMMLYTKVIKSGSINDTTILDQWSKDD